MECKIMTNELEKIQAANAVLLRSVLTPILASTLDLSAAELSDVPTSMLTQFLSQEFYQSLMNQYYLGTLTLIQLAHRGKLTKDNPLIETVNFLHALMQPSDPRATTLIELRDSTLGLTTRQDLLVPAQHANMELWKENSGRKVTAQQLNDPAFDTNTFRHINGAAFVKMFTNLRLPVGESWYMARINQDNAMNVLTRHWEMIVFMMLFATDKLEQVAKIKLPKTQLGYYAEYATHFAILTKLGSSAKVSLMA
jgi:hypothetical protein